MCNSKTDMCLADLIYRMRTANLAKVLMLAPWAIIGGTLAQYYSLYRSTAFLAGLGFPVINIELLFEVPWLAVFT